jgi:hypothetical protein
MVNITVMVVAFPYNFSPSVELNGLFTLALGVASRSFAAWTLAQHMCAENSNIVRIAAIVSGSLSFLAYLYLAFSAVGYREISNVVFHVFGIGGTVRFLWSVRAIHSVLLSKEKKAWDG